MGLTTCGPPCAKRRGLPARSSIAAAPTTAPAPSRIASRRFMCASLRFTPGSLKASVYLTKLSSFGYLGATETSA